MNYHAHIYWKSEEEREIALSLRLNLHDSGCGLGRIKNIPVGPHPFPMYQVMYEGNIKECVEQYLHKNCKSLSILLHEDIGENHKRDHTEGARWIGQKLDLNLNIFD
ncbi:MAG: 4,5-dioxygenase [Rhodobacteraceae bacterium]|nr:4,5-dioxygenase [Paracoccaceae bacterium]MBC65966.1 4,5-dioxygenase [Paracoccaceae bacterium]RZO39235.1 MAG: 4,5-dioxygenase [Paracoccaceae bacterium]